MQESPFKLALRRVMGRLARRDHSEQELRQLLSDLPASVVEGVLQHCREHGWLDERRLLEQAVHSRAARGQGPRKIAFELAQRGLVGDQVREQLSAEGYDWFELAAQLAQRRQGAAPLDLAARRRLMGFLQRRGFNQDQIHYALSTLSKPGSP
ncbi:regulatory protein RecX [Pseudaeromonas paramecii]|uniref:regulatory protein RecX n=1 Tax=Pseudaeromonas paramecii TaxID=2138166 RepID=UPI0031EED71D